MKVKIFSGMHIFKYLSPFIIFNEIDFYEIGIELCSYISDDIRFAYLPCSFNKKYPLFVRP